MLKLRVNLSICLYFSGQAHELHPQSENQPGIIVHICEEPAEIYGQKSLKIPQTKCPERRTWSPTFNWPWYKNIHHCDLKEQTFNYSTFIYYHITESPHCLLLWKNDHYDRNLCYILMTEAMTSINNYSYLIYILYHPLYLLGLNFHAFHG